MSLAGVLFKRRLAQIGSSMSPLLRYFSKRLYSQDVLKSPLWRQENLPLPRARGMRGRHAGQRQALRVRILNPQTLGFTPYPFFRSMIRDHALTKDSRK